MIAILPSKELPSSCSECGMHSLSVCLPSLNITKGTQKQGLYVSGYDKLVHPQCPLIQIDIEELEKHLGYLEELVGNYEENTNYYNQNMRYINTLKELLNKLGGKQ